MSPFPRFQPIGWAGSLLMAWSWLLALLPATSAGAAPVFIYPPTPANGQVYQLAQQQALYFRVQALNRGSSKELSLRATGLPAGATLGPRLPVVGNPVQTVFQWTPTAADAGTYTLTFTASDGSDSVATTVVLRVVVQPCNPVENQPIARPDYLNTPRGTPINISPATLLANDSDPRNQTLRIARVGNTSSGRIDAQADGTFLYTPEAGFSGVATFTYLVQPAGEVTAGEATGHYYEFVRAPGICWPAARDAAAARTYQGLAGYLVTVTSPAEQTLLISSNREKYWLGASDAAVEGEWRWRTGPETNQLFWQGAANGTAVGFSNWAADEPNDSKTTTRPEGEDYGQFYSESGLWNDASACNEGGQTEGYMVEYGGLEACTPVYFATGIVTVNVGAVLATRARTTPALGLTVTPNPASDVTRIALTALVNGPSLLELFDARGRQLRTLFSGNWRAGQRYETSLDVRNLPPGLYLLVARNGSHQTRARLLIP